MSETGKRAQAPGDLARGFCRVHPRLTPCLPALRALHIGPPRKPPRASSRTWRMPFTALRRARMPSGGARTAGVQRRRGMGQNAATMRLSDSPFLEYSVYPTIQTPIRRLMSAFRARQARTRASGEHHRRPPNASRGTEQRAVCCPCRYGGGGPFLYRQFGLLLRKRPSTTRSPPTPPPQAGREESSVHPVATLRLPGRFTFTFTLSGWGSGGSPRVESTRSTGRCRRARQRRFFDNVGAWTVLVAGSTRAPT